MRQRKNVYKERQLEREREREVSFKELAHLIIGASKYKIYKVGR